MISFKKFDLEELIFSFQLGNQFTIDAQLEFIKQINSYTNANMSILNAVELTKQTYADNYGTNSAFCKICNLLVKSIKNGEGQEAVLKKYFHPNIAIAYQVMRYSTDKRSVTEVTDLVQTERELIRDTRSQFISPVLMLVTAFVALFMMGYKVIPMLLERTDNTLDKLPPEVEIALGWASIVTNAGIPIIFLLLTLYVFIKKALPSLTPSNPIQALLRDKLDSTWPISLYKNLWAVRLVKLYGLLKISGLRDIEIIEILKLFSPPFCQFYLDKMSIGFSTGKPLKDFFLKGIITKAQKVRLTPYFTHSSSDEFALGLIEVSNNAILDIKTQFRKVSSKYSLFLFAFGAITFLIAIGSVFETTVFI